MKKVLIALDYNPDSQKVAEKGWSMALAGGADAILLHVISESVNYSAIRKFRIIGFALKVKKEPIQPEGPKDLNEIAQKFLDETKKHLGDSTIMTLIKEGNITESILSVAKEFGVDFIVLGSHSKKRLKNIAMGSVLKKILHLTSVPLVIIPTENDIERHVESDKKAILSIVKD